jgi:hypothetical protein
MVFLSSLAAILANFGVVPLQAGIFSTARITRTSSHVLALSERYMPSKEQGTALTLGYTHSAYGILELNETLPAFTTRNYSLKPFADKAVDGDGNGTWIANTTMYSLGLKCEEGLKATETIEQTTQHGFNSSFGCFVSGETVNDNVVGDKIESHQSRLFSASFIGYYVEHGEGVFYGKVSNQFSNLENRCAGHGMGAFFASFTPNRLRKSDAPNDITAIYCRPSYHEQDVEATVDALTKEPIKVTSIGQVRELSADLFNRTAFEETLAVGQHQAMMRENGLPGNTVPRFLEQLADSELSPEAHFGYPTLAPMAVMAMMASRDHLSELVDPKKLEDAYRLTYQLLFARAMADVLRTDFVTSTREITGLKR